MFSTNQLMARGALITDVTTKKFYEIGQRVTDPNGKVYEYIKTLKNTAIKAGDCLIFNTQITADPDGICDAAVVADGYLGLSGTTLETAVPQEVSLTAAGTETKAIIITYDDADGVRQVSASIALPDESTVGTNIWATKIISIAISGALVGVVDIGWIHSYSDGAQGITTALAAVGSKCGVAEVDVAAIASTNQYMWALVATGGAKTAKLATSSACAAGATLHATATPGELDDADTHPIYGITIGALTGAVDAINPTAVLTYPYCAEETA